MIEPLGNTSLIGKLPASAEYVRLGGLTESLARFDAWVVDNMAFAEGRAGGWEEAFRDGSIHAFVFRAPGNDISAPLVVGAIAPSADSAGRRFPLAAVTLIPQNPVLSALPETLPVLLEDLWQLSGEVLIDARTHSLDELRRRLSENLSRPLDFDDALHSYREWASGTPVTELWRLIYGDSRSSRPLAAVQFVSEAVNPIVGTERPRTPLTLRLPLGSAAGAGVCFWIDAVRRLAGWSGTVPSFFWSHDGERGELLLHLGDAPRATLAELWMPTRRRDEICELASPASDDLPVVAVIPRLQGLFRDESLTVLGLVEALASGTA